VEKCPWIPGGDGFALLGGGLLCYGQAALNKNIASKFDLHTFQIIELSRPNLEPRAISNFQLWYLGSILLPNAQFSRPLSSDSLHLH
jgi:hypothetical protein